MKQKVFTILLIVIAFSFTLPICAQTTGKKQHLVDLNGLVKDGFTGADLPATIVLMRGDSTIIDTVKSSLGGEYEVVGYNFHDIPVEKGKYIAKATLEGYDVAYSDLEVRFIGRNLEFKFPLIKMHRRMDSFEHELDEVTVTGTMVKLVHRGDTLIYNAQAFKVPEGSMLDGLIRQLPGAELKENGDILVNGRKIDNLTLNGDDFFSGNSSVMLHNLPYFTVSQIKVYDKQTDLSRKAGYDVEQRNYTMDVVLKREYNRGYIANAEIGGGTKDRYTAQTFHLGYGDLSRLSVYGNMNNLNQNPRPGDQGDWTPQSMGDGENTSKKAGLDYQTKGREGNWKENFTSEVSWLKNDRHTDSYSQQYADPLDIFSGGKDSRLTRDFNWNANNKLEAGDFTWSVGSSYQEKRVDELAVDSTYNLEERINLSRRNVWNRYRQFNLSSSVNYLKKLPWGDLLIMNASGSYGSQRNKDNNTTNLSYFQLGTDDRQVLTGNNPSHNYQFEGSASYQIRLANNLTFSPTLTYKQSYQHTQFEYLTNDTVDRSSYTSGLLTRSGNASTNLIYVKYGNGGNTTIFTNTLGIERKQEHYNVLSAFGRQTPLKKYWLPYFDSNYAFQSMTNTFMLHYTLSATTPQMSLMYGPNNTIDPLITIWRNSSLKKTVTNHFDVLYTHYFPWRNSYLGTQAYWNAWHGRIGYQKSMDTTTGHYDFRPGNVNGNWNGNINLYGAIDLDSAGHFNLSASSDFLYTHDVDFDITDGGLANTLSKVNNSSFSQTMKLAYKNNNFQAGLTGSFSATHASSQRSGFENFTYYNFNYGVNLQTPLFWKLNFVTDFTIYSRRGYAVESMNENDVVWNASLSRSFLKKKLIVSLEAYDILHQLSKNSVTINSQARREIHVNTIPNYLMLRLQYHFNILPKR